MIKLIHIFLVVPLFLNAQAEKSEKKETRLKLESGLEYLTPTDVRYRDIQTISGNALVGVEFFKKMPFSLYGGITATYAWGTITQFDKNFNHIVNSNNAFGAGPVFLLRFEPFIYKRFSFSPDVSGGLIFYSDRFPWGGDIYNFMLRIGGALHYRVNHKYTLHLGAKWMHVSNGQGIGPHNPSYEAHGAEIGFSRYF